MKTKIHTCKACGTTFTSRRNGCNQYCKPNCRDTQLANRWRPCGMCMGRVGMTASMASRLLGIISKGQVTRYWQSQGMKPDTRAVIAAQKHHKRQSAPIPLHAVYKAYARSRMQDIKDTTNGFDWSCLWHKEQARRSSLERYWSMTDSERVEYNRACLARRSPRKRTSYHATWKRHKRKTDPIYRIIENARTRLSQLVKSKSNTTKELIGCSPVQLQQHLQSQFTDGMSWDNYGSHWHVDHVIPIKCFDHTDQVQVAQCWHWTNLAPLKSEENMRKGAKITRPQMKLMLEYA